MDIVKRLRGHAEHENLDYRAGRQARIKGVPRDRHKNVDWLRGWDDQQDDYNAEERKS